VWNPRSEDSEFFELAWDFETRFQLSWWDSMIVAAAHLSQCQSLLTEDLQNGMRLNNLTVITLPPHTPNPNCERQPSVTTVASARCFFRIFESCSDLITPFKIALCLDE
jgi:hypothetical protein